MFRSVSTACAVGLGLCLAGPAGAQSNPSADQILQSLTPGSGFGTTTRGLRPVGPAAATPAPAATGAAAPAHSASAPAAGARPSPATNKTATASSGPSVNLSVQFRSGSDDLTPAATHTLDELGRALVSPTLSGYRFRIEGHTDTVGTPAANMALSEHRAARVADYLAAHFAIDRARLDPVGMGQDHPLVATPDQTDEPRNRRVQVVTLAS